MPGSKGFSPAFFHLLSFGIIKNHVKIPSLLEYLTKILSDLKSEEMLRKGTRQHLKIRTGAGRCCLMTEKSTVA